MLKRFFSGLACLPLVWCSTFWTPVLAEEGDEVRKSFQRCAQIRDPGPRLACFDRLAGLEDAATGTAAADPADGDPGPAERVREFSRMNLFWELDDDTHGGRGRIRTYRPLLAVPARFSSAPNERPVSPAGEAAEAFPLDSVEAHFRLSLRTKLWDNPVGDNGDVWFAYTQNSYWQAYNSAESSPFRETNYMPELFSVWRTDVSLGRGWQWRKVSVGLKHQSNGRGSVLGISRSWNRLYANFGFEGPDTEVYVRPWIRVLTEDPDDNPDIEDFLGYGDLRVIHHINQRRIEFDARLNPSTGKGMVRLGYHFPLVGDLHGYLSAFSGYGESLLDYNHRQTTVSAGVSMFQF
ncbi:MAG: phospholipase [Wenzhouxiangella sp.]|nr:MAG: phospholipase [Wenzhouxiangella sp.]